VGNLAPVVFSAFGLAGPPASVTRANADTIGVLAFGTTAPLTVTVVDADGSPVRGATVNFAVTTANTGTLGAASVTTDSLGRASTTFTAGGTLGFTAVTATVANTNLPPVTFTLNVTRNNPTRVIVVQGSGQTATVGTQVGVVPTVQVVDAANNPVPGVTVLWSTFGAGAARATRSSAAASR
jgi:protocatechuate 3,4-dioxygenase beta subunit